MSRTEKNIKRTACSFDDADDKLLAGTVQMNLAAAHGVLGDYDAALTCFQRARSHFEEVGDLARLAELHYRRGRLLSAKGVWAESLQEFEGCAAMSVKSATKHLIGLAHLGKAQVYLGMGDSAAACTLVDQALECFSFGNDRVFIAEGYMLKGMICRERKQFVRALWYLTTSVNVHSEMGNTAEAGSCYRELGKLYAAQNKATESRRAFKKSLRCFQRAGARNEIDRVKREIKMFGGNGL